MSITVIRAGTLTDGTGAPSRSDVDIIVSDEQIREIVPAGSLEENESTFIDLSHMTVVPGLIDCHEHLGLIFGEDEMEQGLDAPEYYAMKSVLHVQEML